MTLQNIYEMLCEVVSNEKVAYWTFPKNEAPKLPYIVYFEGPSDNFNADNKVYVPTNAIYIELYTFIEDGRNFELESSIEAKLASNEIVWSKDFEILSSENMIEVIYQTEVIRNGRSE